VDSMKFNFKEMGRNMNLSEQVFGEAMSIGIGGPPEESSELYKAGWWDGCKTGMAAYGNDFFKSSYSFYQNPEHINNLEYYKPWKDAYSYCRYHVGFNTTIGL